MLVEPPSEQTTPPKIAATATEVNAAIDALTHDELKALEAFAHKRITMLGKKQFGRARNDLFQEAITRLLSGNRSWYKDVDFAHYLYWAMKSISDSWINSEKEVCPDVSLDQARLTGDGDNWNPLANIPSNLPNPERLASDKEELERIERLLQDDPAALQILGFLRQGFKGPDIQHATGLTPAAYETIVKRMRSKVRRSQHHEVRDATGL